MPGIAHRAVGHLSRRLDRPELLAAFDAHAARDLMDAVSASTLLAATLKADSCYVDVGANRGQWLPEAQRCAPVGQHIAFEPIPDLCAATRGAFPAVDVRCLALSDRAGTEQFCRFTDERRDGFSGLQRRPEVEGAPQWITVQVSRLDDEIGDLAPALIKIDVEGAELGVLRGAEDTLRRHRPVVVFEHQPEASHLYEVASGDVWNFCDRAGMRVFTLQGRGPLDRGAFTTSAEDGVVNWLAVPDHHAA